MSVILHGGRLDAAMGRWGGTRAQWLDLSTGINRNPYPVGSINQEAWQNLPDEAAESRLIEAARAYYKVADGYGMTPANGTQAILQVLPQVLTAIAGRPVSTAILGPTYGEHEACWRRFSTAETKVVPTLEAAEGHDVIVAVNPDNPTARIFEADELAVIARKQEKRGGYLVVDEAFCDVVPERSLADHGLHNVIVLKSVGKFFGLAGMRLGFAIGSSAVARAIASHLGPWSVSGPALEVGELALADTDWASDARADISRLSAKQADLLVDAGLTVVGNCGLFMLTKSKWATGLHEGLAGLNILTRPFDHDATLLRFGLCRDEEEFVRLGDALQSVSEGLPGE